MTCSALPLLDFIESTRRRDEALATVSNNAGDWMKLALIELAELARNPTGWANLEQGFMGEDVRRMIVPLSDIPITTTRSVP